MVMELILLFAWLLSGQGVLAGEFDTLVAQGKDAVSIGQFQEAERIFKDALSLRPNHPEALYGAGYAAAQLGKRKTAIRHFEGVLKQTYTDQTFKVFHTLALSQIGFIRIAQRRYEEAAQVFEKGVANMPNNADVRYGYGAALRGQGRNEKALQEFEEALKLDPKHIGALVGKASIFYDLGSVPEAFNLLQEAMGLTPQNPLPYGVMSAFYRDLEKPHEQHLTLGHYYFYLGDLSKAANEYRAALAVKETAEAYFTLGSATLQLGQLEVAEGYFKRALKLKVKPADAAWAQLSRVQAKQGQLTKALTSLNKALALNKASAAYHAQLAWISIQLGKTEEAERAAQRALSLDPDLALGYRYLGDVYNVKGLARDAIDMYEKCLARNPSLPDVYVNLGWAYEQVGDVVSAQRNYEIFLRMNPPPEEAKKVKEQIQKLDRQAKAGPVPPVAATWEPLLAQGEDSSERTLPEGVTGSPSRWPWLFALAAMMLGTAGWWLWRRRKHLPAPSPLPPPGE